MRVTVAVAWLVAMVSAEERPVNQPSFYWSEDNAKVYLNVFWQKKLNQKKDDEDSLFGESGFVKPMDEVEVFFDTQHLEIFAYNMEEGYHLDIPLRNRVVIKWSSWALRDDKTGIDIILKKTRIGRWRSVQPLKGAVAMGRDAMQIAMEQQVRYNVFDAIQNQELRTWLETYPYHCLACNAIFDEVYKGDATNRDLWSYFRKEPPKPPKSNKKTTRAWKAYKETIEAEFEFDYTCDRVMSMRATTFGTAAIVGSDVDFACNLIVNNRSVQTAFIEGYVYLQHVMHHMAPESADPWGNPPSLHQIVTTAPELIPEQRDQVCGYGAEACAPIADHKYDKCDACNGVVIMADGILAYPRGDYPRTREEVEDLIQGELCGLPVKGRIGPQNIVAEVCEGLLDEYETELINTLTYKQLPSENTKINPSSIPPAVMDFCGQQTHYCEMPPRIPVKKHEPYKLTKEMLYSLIDEVVLDEKAKEGEKLVKENSDFKEFDILHAQAVEGRTWVTDLPEDKQFNGNEEDLHKSRKDRYLEFEPLAEKARMKKEAAAAEQEKANNFAAYLSEGGDVRELQEMD